jgi:lipoprotein-releasing system permease protein
MIRLLFDLAVTHVVGRGRQTVVSVLGVALGVGFRLPWRR